ncbi:hypothetical protein OG422_16045 [Streptomyces sp. NBC_01525]|uniref:hypothetical protein n=1 Tax=Streptomyces sp. NBC_01525 TaxID=2903893 RepID=UPI003870EE40
MGNSFHALGPTLVNKQFWKRICDAGAGAMTIHPANVGGLFFDYLHGGNGGGIASRALSFLEELTQPERTAVAGSSTQ